MKKNQHSRFNSILKILKNSPKGKIEIIAEDPKEQEIADQYMKFYQWKTDQDNGK